MIKAKRRKFHLIYKTVCNITNRYYIGMHSTDNLKDDYYGSGKFLRNSIRKHGIENHTTEHLEFLTTREKLKEREKQLVTEELVNDPMCMNLKVGGEGGWEYINENRLNGFCDPEVALKARLATNKILHDKLQNDPEYRKMVCGAISSSLKARYKVTKHNWVGKKHTEETKKKQSEAASKKTGDKNSQYGTCWITRSEENKKIKVTDLPIYITEGWVRGRKV